jgi:hypothetical protein
VLSIAIGFKVTGFCQLMKFALLGLEKCFPGLSCFYARIVILINASNASDESRIFVFIF